MATHIPDFSSTVGLYNKKTRNLCKTKVNPFSSDLWQRDQHWGIHIICDCLSVCGPRLDTYTQETLEKSHIYIYILVLHATKSQKDIYSL